MARRYTRTGPGWLTFTSGDAIGEVESGIVYHTSQAVTLERVDAICDIAEIHVVRHVTDPDPAGRFVEVNNVGAVWVVEPAGTRTRRPAMDGATVGDIAIRLRELLVVERDPIVGRPKPATRRVAVYPDGTHHLWRLGGRTRQLVAIGDTLGPAAVEFV